MHAEEYRDCALSRGGRFDVQEATEIVPCVYVREVFRYYVCYLRVCADVSKFHVFIGARLVEPVHVYTMCTGIVSHSRATPFAGNSDSCLVVFRNDERDQGCENVVCLATCGGAFWSNYLDHCFPNG